MKVSEVIGELKPYYEQVIEIMHNKDYSPEHKDDMVKQIFIKINEYLEKKRK